MDLLNLCTYCLCFIINKLRQTLNGELQERKISVNHLRTTKPHVDYQIVLTSVGRCENARGIREIDFTSFYNFLTEF